MIILWLYKTNSLGEDELKPIFYAEGVRFQNIHYPTVSIEEGQMVFLRGESGCGKSTLLKLFNATLNADQGKIFYQDQPIESLPTLQLRKEVLLVSQMVYLFEGSVEENFHQYYAYREESALSKEEIQKYLNLCCFNHARDTSCTHLSGGERQRVFLAIALSFQPKVLMLDEPTAALDEKTAHQLFHNLTAFCKEHQMTMLAITHDPQLAERFSDKQILLKKVGDV